MIHIGVTSVYFHVKWSSRACVCAPKWMSACLFMSNFPFEFILRLFSIPKEDWDLFFCTRTLLWKKYLKYILMHSKKSQKSWLMGELVSSSLFFSSVLWESSERPHYFSFIHLSIFSPLVMIQENKNYWTSLFVFQSVIIHAHRHIHKQIKTPRRGLFDSTEFKNKQEVITDCHNE